MRKQLRQTCKEMVNGQPCGASYRYPEDFAEHQRLAHKPVEDNSNRPTFSDKDADDLINHVALEPQEATPQPQAKRKKK